MKSATASLTFVTILALAAAFPATTGTNPTEHELVARKVPEFKGPWFSEGVCTNRGCSDPNDSFMYPARCVNSHCGSDGNKCIIAHSEKGPDHGQAAELKLHPLVEVKCSINNLSYEWDWSWLSDEQKVQKKNWEDYEKCTGDLKAMNKDKDGTESREIWNKKNDECEAIGKAKR